MTPDADANAPSPIPPEHRAGRAVARCAVITISDTRTPAEDRSGDAIVAALEAAGHAITFRTIVPDEGPAIAAMVQQAIDDDEVDLCVSTGGTGVSPRDITPESVRPLLERDLPGFATLFTQLSYEQVGSAAMLSRALAGVTSRTIIACLPGSPKAVALAMDKLVLPEIGHLLTMVGK